MSDLQPTINRYYPVLMKLYFSRQILENLVRYQIVWKYVQWGRSSSVRMDGRTEECTGSHDDANGRFSQFCERADN